MFNKNENKTCKVGNADLKENMDAFNGCIKTMSEMKNVKGFLILVDNSYGMDTEDKKHSPGMKAACGSLKTLVNLVSNIDSEIMDEYQNITKAQKGIDILEELLKNLKN